MLITVFASLSQPATADEVPISARLLEAGNRHDFTLRFGAQAGREQGRQTMAALFEEFATSRSARTWLAVEKYHDYVDASLRAEFNYYCFQAMEREPLVYYLRYLNGDDNALLLMRSAMSYDYRDPTMQGDNDRSTVRAVFDSAMKQMQAHELSCRSKAGRRLDYFKAFNAQMRAWNAMTGNR